MVLLNLELAPIFHKLQLSRTDQKVLDGYLHGVDAKEYAFMGDILQVRLILNLDFTQT